MRKSALAALCVVLLVSCTRPKAGVQVSPAATGSPPPQDQPATPPKPAAPAQTDGSVSYIPSKSRVLFPGDDGEGSTSWLTLGAGFAELRTRGGGKGITVAPATLYSGEAALTEAGLLPVLTRVSLLGGTAWERVGARFRKLYHVRTPSGTGSLEGWVDSGSCAVIVAEHAGLAVGALERKIVISDGDSEYSVLVLARTESVTLIDTSVYIFPDAFHPGGIVSADIEDVNGDGVPEIVVAADFIVSLSYLGASPLRAELWLQEKGGTVAPILRINRSFGTDEGYEYSAERTVLDTDGDGFRETVRVVTEHREQAGPRNFHNTLVSFFVWDGAEYRKDAAQDLPKIGTLNVDGVTLAAEPGAGAAAGTKPDTAGVPSAGISKGTAVFVFDRGNVSEQSGSARVFWYRVLTRDNREGWVRGTDMTMEWVDPYKVNRAAFLGTTEAEMP